MLSHPKVYRPAVDATEPCDVQVQVRRAFTFDVLPRTSSETDLLGSSVGKRLQRSPRASPTQRFSPPISPRELSGSPGASPQSRSPRPQQNGCNEESVKPVLRGMPGGP